MALTKSTIFKQQLLQSDVRRMSGIKNYILRDLEYFDDFKQIFDVETILI